MNEVLYNESWHIWMRFSIMSHHRLYNESWHIWMSHYLYNAVLYNEMSRLLSRTSTMQRPFNTLINASNVTWPIHTWHDSFICVMTHSYVPWLIHMCQDSSMCAMTRCSHRQHFQHDHPFVKTWHDPFIRDMTHSYVPWLIHMTLSTRSSICKDVTWPIHTWHDSSICAMTHSYDTFNTIVHLYRRDMTHSYVWSLIRV